jgi:hypothetical protein
MILGSLNLARLICLIQGCYGVEHTFDLTGMLRGSFFRFTAPVLNCENSTDRGQEQGSAANHNAY